MSSGRNITAEFAEDDRKDTSCRNRVQSDSHINPCVVSVPWKRVYDVTTWYFAKRQYVSEPLNMKQQVLPSLAGSNICCADYDMNTNSKIIIRTEVRKAVLFLYIS